MTSLPPVEWPSTPVQEGVRYDGISIRLVDSDGSWVIVTGQTVEDLARLARTAGYPFDPALVSRSSVVIPAVRREPTPGGAA